MRCVPRCQPERPRLRSPALTAARLRQHWLHSNTSFEVLHSLAGGMVARRRGQALLSADPSQCRSACTASLIRHQAIMRIALMYLVGP